MKWRIHEDRLVAVLLLILTAGYWTGVAALTTLRSDDVVGPAGFPGVLATILVILCVFLLARPDLAARWESVAGRVWLHWAMFLAYTLLMPIVGFLLATTVFLFIVFVMLQASAGRAFLAALGTSAFCFFLFSTLLELRLPVAPWR